MARMKVTFLAVDIIRHLEAYYNISNLKFLHKSYDGNYEVCESVDFIQGDMVDDK